MVRFIALDTDLVRSLQSGGPDANGQRPERHISKGSGTPCRHCLTSVNQGEPYLILSHRPFPSPQPYAEQGPIFLHAETCEPYMSGGGVPAMLESPHYLIRAWPGMRLTKAQESGRRGGSVSIAWVAKVFTENRGGIAMVRFIALDTDLVRSLQSGGPDANGQRPERHISKGSGTPCRHCLTSVNQGEPYLILSHRPFPSPQPYAEQGPIFLHAETCEPYMSGGGVPAMLESPHYLIRGYDDDNRIVYGSGKVVATADIPDAAADLLADRDIAYIHVRSASNNCYQCRIDRA